MPDEFHLLQYRATIAAVRRRIEAKGLPVRDAFIAFNSSKTGALSCSEMYGALEWLGIRVTPSQVTLGLEVALRVSYVYTSPLFVEFDLVLVVVVVVVGGGCECGGTTAGVLVLVLVLVLLLLRVMHFVVTSGDH